MVFLSGGRYASRTRSNLLQSGLGPERGGDRRLLRESVTEAGKGALETLAIWLRPEASMLRLVRDCHGWEHVDSARARGRGIIFISPHLGAFELANLFLSSRLPLTFLYSPPRQRWLEPLMQAGRERGEARGAAADIGGVKKLLRVLRANGAIGILPDQVPGRGEGTWVDFFGRPAYTMTLIARLLHTTGAAAILVRVRRLAWSRGFEVELMPFEPAQRDDVVATTAELNRAVEGLIRACPSQYLWSYNRSKVPAGVNPP